MGLYLGDRGNGDIRQQILACVPTVSSLQILIFTSKKSCGNKSREWHLLPLQYLQSSYFEQVLCQAMGYKGQLTLFLDRSLCPTGPQTKPKATIQRISPA